MIGRRGPRGYAGAAGSTGPAGADGEPAGWALASKPAVPHAYDDEFESGSYAGWTQGGTPVATAIDPYANFTTAGNWRHSNNGIRPGWLMVQPAADGSPIAVVHKGITVPTTLLMWSRISYDSRYSSTITNNDHTVGIRFSTTSAGAPNLDDSVSLMLVETDANEYAIEFQKTVATVFTATEFVTSIAQERLNFEYVAIHKIGTTYHFWIAPPNGSRVYLGSTTHSATFDRVSLVAGNAATTAPGNMIMGFDFIRFVESATHLP